MLDYRFVSKKFTFSHLNLIGEPLYPIKRWISNSTRNPSERGEIYIATETSKALGKVPGENIEMDSKNTDTRGYKTNDIKI